MQRLSGESTAFSKWRRRLFPIYGKEVLTFFPLLFMKLLVSFNYTLLHATKDTLIVTGKGSGAEVIPLLKGGVVLLAAFLFMLAYSRLSNRLTFSQLFYAAITPFILFFLCYGFFLYPYREALSPTESADRLQAFLGEGRGHWVVLYRNWMDALFFIAAELWGGVVIALLFWGFANRISSLSEASRYYPILSAGGHLGVIASGPLLWALSDWYSDEAFSSILKVTMGIVAIVTLLIVATFAWLDRNKAPAAAIAKKSGLSLHEGLFQVLRSPSLGAIAVMVIGYGLSVNMVEVLWKGTLKGYYPRSQDYQAFMGLVSTATGFLSLFLALFVGSNILRKWGWQLSAQLTPLVLGMASVAFLATFFWGEAVFGASLFWLVIIGGIHNVACKSMKYCLFDPTKEMAYIPLPEDVKVKGKAAVDVVASRFGKSGASWIQIALMELMGTGSILVIAPFLAPFIVLALIAWSSSILFLGRSSGASQECAST